MTKDAKAQYLVNLESLMSTIQAKGNKRPRWMVEEYERVWNDLKQEVKDEARQRDDSREFGPEARAVVARS